MPAPSVFYPPFLIDRILQRTDAWAAEARRQIIDAAAPWAAMDDRELWELIYTPCLTRAWQVWSNGHCPACEKDVREYDWQIDPFARPWKARCPHCALIFPTNDFAAYYRSGLDEQGEFDRGRADRSLLFNQEHPDPADPLHTWGVDDGEGFALGERRWRFIAAYLIYGQWKKLILEGIRRLADAHVVSQEARYARKAGILLHRLADVYPRMDYETQGLVYETPGCRGYLSVWHDACAEVIQLALAYDAVRPGLDRDLRLVNFLHRRAHRHGLPLCEDVQAVRTHIERDIFQHTVEHAERIRSNLPAHQVARLVIDTVLGWPDCRGQVMAQLDSIIEEHTRVDGLTGEKGTPGYSSILPGMLATLIERFARIEPDFLPCLLERHSSLRDTWRFHLDTWCLQNYYPSCGDGGSFVAPAPQYVGVYLAPPDAARPADWLLEPSMYHFLWRLYQATGEVGYVQALVQGNGGTAADLPHDLFAEDAPAVQARIEGLIERHGREIVLPSVNKEKWHLAILRSGRGARARAAWLDYDSGFSHCHHDALNLGLFARGLDLMPDFGYTPTSFGGHETPEAIWYVRTAAHNTVVVDGRDQRGRRWGYAEIAAGRTTLWAQGEGLHAIRVACADAYEACSQYERTVLLVDVGEEDFYLLDIFRVVGGSDHAKFTHSHYGTITTQGLNLREGEPFGHDTMMRHFRHDPAPAATSAAGHFRGWWVDWAIDDRKKLLPAGTDLHFRYTDLTVGAAAAVCEGWIVSGHYNSTDVVWIPRVMTRRQASGGEPLRSTFVAVSQVYEGRPVVTAARRLPLMASSTGGHAGAAGSPCGDDEVAVEITLADGRRDVIIAPNPLPAAPRAGSLVQPDHALTTDADLTFVRLDPAGRQERIVKCRDGDADWH